MCPLPAHGLWEAGAAARCSLFAPPRSRRSESRLAAPLAPSPPTPAAAAAAHPRYPPLQSASYEEFYLRKGNGKKLTYLKVEGNSVKKLKTGMKVSMQATTLAAANGGRKQRVRANAINVLQQPSRPSRNRRNLLAEGAQQQLEQEQQREGASREGRSLLQGGLPTEGLAVTRAVVDTLVLPISFEGCAKTSGGTYGKPWYTKAVSSAWVVDVIG